MAEVSVDRRPVVDWLTTMAIAAVAVSLTIGLHEGVHALTCVLVGGDLQELSALHVVCEAGGAQAKLVAGSASIANLLLGVVSLAMLRGTGDERRERQFFWWLFMLTNWLYGAGYWMFSGIGNIGDWATVIAGWQPHWLWRLLMTLVGVGSYLFLVWFALHELGKIIGGEGDEQIGRAVRLGLLAYVTAAAVVLLAGLLNPYGLASVPVLAGLLAVLGGLSPLLWMMQWFRARGFAKRAKAPLVIRRQGAWIVAAVAALVVYGVVLGRTVYFG